MSNKRLKQKRAEVSIKKAIRRIICLAFLFVLSGTGLVGRVAYLKVAKGDEYEKRVTLRSAGVEYEIQPLRGNIVDRNGKNLVVSAIAYDVVLDPYVLLQNTKEEQSKTLNTLSKELGVNIKELEDILKKSPDSKYEVIEKEVPSAVGKKLQEAKLKGVWLKETFVRDYPKQTLASQTIGFFNKNKQGQYGLEQQYNDLMTGFTGRVFPKLQEGNIVISESVSAISGHTLVTTIDEVIQQYLEAALEKASLEFKPINAAAIAMNPDTGEILAMGSYPTYNPNQYNDISDQVGEEIWAALNDEEKVEKLNETWKNYNIHMTYEPGSTFKPIFVAAALEEGVISENQQFYCQGYKQIPGEPRPIRCAKRSGHGNIDLEEALAVSCNVAMMEIAEKLGAKQFVQYQKDFGLGEATGIDLPGEEAGILHRYEQMGPVELATASFGQTFTMTPMQLISAFSATINGGKLMKPYVLSQVIDEESNIIQENKPFLRRKVISKEVSDIIRLQSESVVTKGSGKSAAIPGYRIGGKTGTAEKLPREDGKRIFSFIGYAPVDNPQIVVLILFDETEVDGTGLPARVFQEMMGQILPYLGIQPVDVIPGISDETVTLPDFSGMDIYAVSEATQAQELDYTAIGVGKVVKSQYPNPGSNIPTGTTIKLYFTSEEPESCVAVPDFFEKTREEAQNLAKEEGFVVEIQGQGDMVYDQIPKAGMKIEKGSTVKLVLNEEIIE